MHLHIATDAVVQLDRDISSMLHDCVRHVRKVHWLSVVMLTADGEKYLGVYEYL